MSENMKIKHIKSTHHKNLNDTQSRKQIHLKHLIITLKTFYQNESANLSQLLFLYQRTTWICILTQSINKKWTISNHKRRELSELELGKKINTCSIALPWPFLLARKAINAMNCAMQIKNVYCSSLKFDDYGQ